MGMDKNQELADEVHRNLTEPPEAIVIDGIEIVDAEMVDRVRQMARNAELPAIVSETASGIVALIHFLEEFAASECL